MPHAKSGRSFGAIPRFWPVLLCGVLAPAPGFAGSLVAGDGSWASNPQLVSPVPIADQANWTPAPLETDAPFFDIDWSAVSKGSVIRDSSGSRFEASFAPSASLSHTGTRLNFGGTASAQLTKPQDGAPVNLDQLLLSGTSSFEVGPLARLDSNASFTMTQEDPNAADVPDDVAATPIEFSGAADAAYTQKFGHFDLTAKANAGRDVYGPTRLTDASTLDNTSQNNTRFGGGLRLGFELTPILEPFVDGEATRTVFDAPSPTLATKLDGDQYTLMAGVSAQWETLTASASAGVGLQHFDDPGLADVEATLYDASLTYQPTEALTLTGAFTTSIGAPGPNGAGTARISYAATAGAVYKVNEWLDGRASAAWHDTRYAGSTGTDRGYDLGVGADFIINEHARLTADYGFDHSEVTPNPAEDTHTISVGLTLQK